MPNPIQIDFRRHQQPGWPGSNARPNQPYAFDTGVLNIPASGNKPRPGEPVYYNATNNAFQLPASAANQLVAVGLIVYDSGVVQATLAAPGTSMNSDAFIEYNDGDIVKVAVMGTFFLLVGAAVEYGNLLTYNRTDRDWDVLTKPAAFANLVDVPVTCVSRSPVASGGIAEARIGYGRVL